MNQIMFAALSIITGVVIVLMVQNFNKSKKISEIYTAQSTYRIDYLKFKYVLTCENCDTSLTFRTLSDANEYLTRITVRDVELSYILPDDLIVNNLLSFSDTVQISRFVQRAEIGKSAVLEDCGSIIMH